MKIMLDLFDEWEQQGLLLKMEKCFHPQLKVTPMCNYYIARDWRDAELKSNYDLYETLVFLERKYGLKQSRLYAIRKAFQQPVD